MASQGEGVPLVRRQGRHLNAIVGPGVAGGAGSRHRQEGDAVTAGAAEL